jgi:hypothetical protein
MRSGIRWAAVGVFVAALAAATRADEEKLTPDKLPKVVLDAVKKRFPEAEVKKAGKEVEDGKTFYEVGIVDKGQKIDVTLTPEGAITELEKEVAARDLPKVVADALEAKYPKAEYKKVEEIIKVADGKETLESYEALLVTADKTTVEAVVSPEGKITKEEVKKPKEKK